MGNIEDVFFCETDDWFHTGYTIVNFKLVPTSFKMNVMPMHTLLPRQNCTMFGLHKKKVKCVRNVLKPHVLCIMKCKLNI